MNIKSEILSAVRDYTATAHARKEFVPGVTEIPYAGRVFDADEVEAAVGGSLDFWLTLGKEGEAFEKEFAAKIGVARTILTNSGSSANLLALSALTSDKLGDRRLKPGDEVITVAAGFPTTVAPIVQVGCVPVFIDSDTRTLNAPIDRVSGGFSPRTKAVMMAHTLGNPFDLGQIRDFCELNKLWLIEDNCDALGSTYNGQWTGTFGDLSTQSFFPAHHMTMGEGGAVNVNRSQFHRLIEPAVESFRDWGRDCWCSTGCDNTCHKRFGWQLGELPEGYDHKYTYRHLGYNLKPLDIQAAIGRQQLKKLDAFNNKRRFNSKFLRSKLHELGNFFEFAMPTHASKYIKELAWHDNDDSGCHSDPAWFGFSMMVRPDAPFTRNEFAKFLTSAKIGNRMLFGGNLTKQPAFVHLKQQNPQAFRTVGNLEGADAIMNRCIFIGTYPGLTQSMLDYMVESIHSFVRNY